jgi:hypothetical protein
MNDIAPQGSRARPEPVTPVEHNGVRYEAESTHVRAYDIASGNLLWDKEVYKLDSPGADRNAPPDDSGNYIARLGIAEGKLMILTALADTHYLDL